MLTLGLADKGLQDKTQKEYQQVYREKEKEEVDGDEKVTYVRPFKNPCTHGASQ
jgi:hypothetical protein